MGCYYIWINTFSLGRLFFLWGRLRVVLQSGKYGACMYVYMCVCIYVCVLSVLICFVIWKSTTVVVNILLAFSVMEPRSLWMALFRILTCCDHLLWSPVSVPWFWPIVSGSFVSEWDHVVGRSTSVTSYYYTDHSQLNEAPSVAKWAQLFVWFVE